MNRLCILFSLSLICQFAYTQGTPMFVEVTSGLTQPVGVVHAGDNSDRLFIVERAGVIQLLKPGSPQVEAIPFLDIRTLVDDLRSEQGLLGLAFDPQYESNGYFYVNYIANGSSNDTTKISRFTVDSSNPDIADPNSKLDILKYTQYAWNHNGGDLHFGPDGYLYIASGDGGGSNDPQNNGQNTSSLLGAILRIDVHNTDNRINYSIPSDNPFNNEIWLYGLRNPWRFSFDTATGDLYIADVGQNAREEVNVVPAGIGGLNLGWDCREGFINSSGCTGTFHDPIYDYNHSIGSSVTGGYVYRGNTFPNFQGWYFFADFNSNRLFQTNGTIATGLQSEMTTVNGGASNISSFGQSKSGELYAVAYSGKLYRIIDLDDCPLLTLNIPSVTNTSYVARNLITSTAVVPSNTNLSYGAAEIVLNADFSVPTTTTFETLVGICGSR